jgi:hypothetical protein
MGLGIVLIVWAVVGIVLASLAALALGGLAAFLTSDVQRSRNRVIGAAILLPYACLAWAGFLFIVQGVVNEGFLHRDVGLGDTSHCPLPNGYQILFIDVTDNGWVYNPRTQAADSIVERQDSIPGVRQLEVEGRFILMAADSKAWTKFAPDNTDVDSYILLDTQTDNRTNFEDYNSFRAAALEMGIEPRLEPIFTVYRRYRFSWFDVLIVVLLCGPPLAALLSLARYIFRLRRTRVVVT